MRLLPTCKEASRLQSEAFDTRLTFPRRLGLQLHLLVCGLCRRYGRQITFLRKMAGELGEDETLQPAQRLSADARERIQRKLNSENL